MNNQCNHCKKNVAKDPVLCKVCATAVAHPGCASKSSRNNPQMWTCSNCRQESSSQGSEGPDTTTLMDQITSMETNLTARFETMMQKFVEMEKSLNFFEGKYEELLKQSAEQKALIVDLKKALEGVQEKVREKDAALNQLSARLNQVEQSNLVLNMEFHNVPMKEKENVLEVVQSLADQVGAPRVSDTVVDAYRLPGRPPRVAGESPRAPPIVVKVKAASVKMAWLAGRRRLQQPRQADDVSEEAPTTAAAVAAERPRRRGPPPVRIYEQLTPYNKRLLFLTRTAAAQKGFRFVWVRDGKIFARHSEQLGALVRIRCEDDIRTRMGVNVATTHI
ncbi:uncharacterized protein LOC132196289 [Neocloeon triangulifer]|uniref:uncharacterized protein LOC132196289 n=1 Tax=Neocloeon triangulifer TaxID=2078957 RepID=UPI00286F0463|nr:uncharacterized protein LOC132196289 [Neocloeon triangulifer]